MQTHTHMYTTLHYAYYASFQDCHCFNGTLQKQSDGRLFQDPNPFKELVFPLLYSQCNNFILLINF